MFRIIVTGKGEDCGGSTINTISLCKRTGHRAAECFQAKGISRMNKTAIRRFRADYVKAFDGDGIGIGIVEYGGKHKSYNWELQVLAIHSIYVPGSMSNRDIRVSIFQYLSNLIGDNERIVLQMNKLNNKKLHHQPYTKFVKVSQIEWPRGRLFHASLLAKDALKRKNDIVEVFDGYMSFSIVQQEKEEEEGVDIRCKKESRVTPAAR